MYLKAILIHIFRIYKSHIKGSIIYTNFDYSWISIIPQVPKLNS